MGRGEVTLIKRGDKRVVVVPVWVGYWGWQIGDEEPSVEGKVQHGTREGGCRLGGNNNLLFSFFMNPGDRWAKLLANAQRTAKATSRQRPGQLLPEGEDSQDITIKCLQTQLAKIAQILVNNKLMKPTHAVEGRSKRLKVPPREGQKGKQHESDVDLESRSDSKSVASSNSRVAFGMHTGKRKAHWENRLRSSQLLKGSKVVKEPPQSVKPNIAGDITEGPEVMGKFKTRGAKMAKYLAIAKTLLTEFRAVRIQQVGRDLSADADALAGLTLVFEGEAGKNHCHRYNLSS
ncbi:hypothetical protein Acr_00g0048000 [Actinidia rufa]|uniref:Uncharacterized protein n=1 Tax=Actinidia rufa TaxID=165716 RepID=A0A7J0DK23_9ERIC|nr:hypothetical protein Acr_00g0048000 [Actinidia rufa]